VAHAVAAASQDAVLFAAVVVGLGTLMSLLIPKLPLEPQVPPAEELATLVPIDPELALREAAVT